ncbi:MAG: hypothetical protein ACRDPA_18595, partial [Solirubrobacteraceae bacterium]
MGRQRRVSRRLLTAGCAAVVGLGLVGIGQGGAAASSSYKLEIAIFNVFSGPNGQYGYFNYYGCVPAADLINQAGGIM